MKNIQDFFKHRWIWVFITSDFGLFHDHCFHVLWRKVRLWQETSTAMWGGWRIPPDGSTSSWRGSTLGAVLELCNSFVVCSSFQTWLQFSTVFRVSSFGCLTSLQMSPETPCNSSQGDCRFWKEIWMSGQGRAKNSTWHAEFNFTCEAESTPNRLQNPSPQLQPHHLRCPCDWIFRWTQYQMMPGGSNDQLQGRWQEYQSNRGMESKNLNSSEPFKLLPPNFGCILTRRAREYSGPCGGASSNRR